MSISIVLTKFLPLYVARHERQIDEVVLLTLEVPDLKRAEMISTTIPFPQEIFMMFVEQLRGLEDIEGKSFKRYFYLLENLACVKTFILCMELDAPDIILSLFRTFFQVCFIVLR